MAQYFTDFRDDAVDSGLPDGWTNRWASLNASTVSGNPLVDSSVSFLARQVGSYTRDAASWDEVPSSNEVAVRADLTLSLLPTQSGIVSPVICGSGTQATRTGYFALIRASNDVLLRRSVGGMETTLATTSAVAPFTDTRHIIELSVNASGIIELYFWPESAAKPAAPLLFYNDSASLLSAGWVGWLDVSDLIYEGATIHSFSAGTNGDQAPTSPISSAAPTLSTPTATATTSNSISFSIPVSY